MPSLAIELSNDNNLSRSADASVMTSFSIKLFSELSEGVIEPDVVLSASPMKNNVCSTGPGFTTD